MTHPSPLLLEAPLLRRAYRQQPQCCLRVQVALIFRSLANSWICVPHGYGKAPNRRGLGREWRPGLADGCADARAVARPNHFSEPK